MLDDASSAGVDVSAVLRTSRYPTGTYLAIVDAAGELQFAIDDMRATTELSPVYIRERVDLFQQASLLFIDANIPKTPYVQYCLWHIRSICRSVPTRPRYSGESYPGEQMEYTQTVLEVGAGVQYNFIPTPLGFDPYIALDLSFNSFGKLEENDIEVSNTEINRFGGGIGLGTEVTIIPLIN